MTILCSRTMVEATGIFPFAVARPSLQLQAAWSLAATGADTGAAADERWYVRGGGQTRPPPVGGRNIPQVARSAYCQHTLFKSSSTVRPETHHTTPYSIIYRRTRHRQLPVPALIGGRTLCYNSCRRRPGLTPAIYLYGGEERESWRSTQQSKSMRLQRQSCC